MYLGEFKVSLSPVVVQGQTQDLVKGRGVPLTRTNLRITLIAASSVPLIVVTAHTTLFEQTMPIKFIAK